MAKKTQILLFLIVALAALIPFPLSSAQRQSELHPSEATKARLQPLIKGILAAWDKFDVVCLGEDHGSRNDSDLRIALVEDPAFVSKVRVIMIESASVTRQDVLDRFVLEGEDMPREKLRIVWSEASGSEVWESPIYEEFIRAVHRVNLKLPREQRVRVLAGDNPKDSNRGRFIREAVSREILDKKLKGLTIYGAGHCENRAMGYPGEIGDKYPGRIWSAFQFYNVDEGRRLFGLSDAPALIPITGTDKAKLPIGKIFFMGQYNDPSTLGDLANAVVYFGNVKDVKVRAEK
jgi:hypothetical protein